MTPLIQFTVIELSVNNKKFILFFIIFFFIELEKSQFIKNDNYSDPMVFVTLYISKHT